jgi:lipocalin
MLVNIFQESAKYQSMLSLLTLSLLLLGASAQIGPPTIEELDVGQYIGRWYQTYASPIVYQTFEKDGFCCTATYGVYNDTVLTVYNAQRVGAPTGPGDDIEGFAFTTDDPGKLLVGLGSSAAFPGAPYWIIQLGPVSDYGGVSQYAYSIVSDPTYLYLFVLVRDVDEFRAMYEQDVLAWLAANGFDTVLNRPIETYHEPDCIYPW